MANATRALPSQGCVSVCIVASSDSWPPRRPRNRGLSGAAQAVFYNSAGYSNMQTGRITPKLPRRKPVQVVLFLCGLALAAAISVVVVGHGRTREVGYHQAQLEVGGDSYRYLVFVPASYRAASRVPLVVVLHGCSTTANQQAVASGYAQVAEQRGFIVLYPDVDPADLAHEGCWKGIWDPGAEGRGRGDAGAIAAMTSAVVRTWRIDPGRVYVIGISAGAFESSILGASYPDVYAAIGIHSGAAYMGGELGCLAEGVSPSSTAALARAALGAMATHARVMPVIVFHGDQDEVVPYRCGEQALHQWLDTDNLLLERKHRAPVPGAPAAVRKGLVPRGRTYTVASYPDGQGCIVAQFWTIHEMGHAWSGGSSDPSVSRYVDTRGPSAAAASSSFFLRWRMSGPVAPCARRER
jgi:poly(hydroxyalkanoate) depolymerase family esterase